MYGAGSLSVSSRAATSSSVSGSSCVANGMAEAAFAETVKELVLRLNPAVAIVTMSASRMILFFIIVRYLMANGANSRVHDLEVLLHLESGRGVGARGEASLPRKALVRRFPCVSSRPYRFTTRVVGEIDWRGKELYNLWSIGLRHKLIE